MTIDEERLDLNRFSPSLSLSLSLSLCVCVFVRRRRENVDGEFRDARFFFVFFLRAEEAHIADCNEDKQSFQSSSARRIIGNVRNLAVILGIR